MSQPPDTGTPVCYRHPGREANIRCQRCGRPICPDCMRDAAVGFQCPSCVNEGRKTTRQAVAPYGGSRSANPALTSFGLIGINVFVWVLVLVTGWQDSPIVERLSLVPKGLCSSLADPSSYYSTVHTHAVCATVQNGDGHWTPGVADGAYWQLISSLFMHVQIWHIAGNMLALYVLGPQLEAVLGRARFLALYLVSGLAGSAVVYWASDEYGLTLGASGAIFGLFGAFVVLVHKVGGDLRAIGGLIAVNVFITFAVPHVSWQGHLGGFLGGLAVTAILAYAPRPRRTLVQAVGVGALVVLIAVAIAVRTAALA